MLHSYFFVISEVALMGIRNLDHGMGDLSQAGQADIFRCRLGILPMRLQRLRWSQAREAPLQFLPGVCQSSQ